MASTYVNAPRYLLRKSCILKLISDLPAGKALEIGCGAGDLCETLFHLGYTIEGIDFSDEAIAVCRERLKEIINDPRIKIHFADFFTLSETYDVIFMMEVLEHLEDDQGALKKIHELIKPQGHLLLSVPANQKWFGPYDRYAGHYRRYNRPDLTKLLNDSGFDVQTAWSYGVPLTNLTEVVRNHTYGRRSVESKEEGTKQSGVKRDIDYKLRFLYNGFFMFPFYLLQNLFFKTNLGTGLIVKAVKK